YHAFLPSELRRYFGDESWDIEEFYFTRKGERVGFWRSFNLVVIARKNSRGIGSSKLEHPMSFLRYNDPMPAKKVTILDVPFDAVTYREALEAVERTVQGGKREHWVTANPEMLVQAETNPDFLHLLKNAEMILPDGAGILWAATYLQKTPPNNRFLRYFHWLGSLAGIALIPSRYHRVIPQRVTGIDLMVQIVEQSQHKGWRMFLLGAEPGVAQIAAENLKHRYSEVQIVGTCAGNPALEEEEEICRRINETAPDILFVAYGSPAQEFWIARNLNKFTTVKMAMGVGGAFDFIAGKIRRAPRWMRTLGIEWMWRLYKQPKRFKRIWRAAVLFPRLVLRERLS
ncbi:MAG: WecB/TagA/CpsF family glycosyltransferase, partial [Candidatus Peregrinibacteria bacterium]